MTSPTTLAMGSSLPSMPHSSSRQLMPGSIDSFAVVFERRRQVRSQLLARRRLAYADARSRVGGLDEDGIGEARLDAVEDGREIALHLVFAAQTSQSTTGRPTARKTSLAFSLSMPSAAPSTPQPA